MSPIQQMLLGAGGAVATKTYVDDVFSTFLYKGNGTSTGDTQTINNGINLSESGGMVWLKSRDSSSYWHTIVDTVRGANKTVYPNSSFQQETLTNVVNSFNNNGFTAAYNSSYSGVFANKNNDNVASWTFRKAKGFFDIVKYTGNGQWQTGRNISHSLNSVPACIVIKNLDSNVGWQVYHRGTDSNSPENYRMRLEESDGRSSGSGYWFDTAPTATHFTVGNSAGVNNNNENYIAYLFAGGESTQNEAVSVDFDGSGDYLSLASTSDFNFGTGDFTVEFWALTNSYSGSPYFCDFRTDGSDTGTTNRIVWYISSSDGKPIFWVNGSARITASNATTKGAFSHYALVRSSGTTTMYINGISQGTYSDSTNYGDAPLVIGQRQGSYASQSYDGKISNFRIVKGTAVYTSSFRPLYEPLTNITNTKLLCCNNSSTTGSTVTPGTITANGNPTASSDSPFDDPAGFVFGESESENVIKCGSYSISSQNQSDINLGWEPSFLLVKKASGTSNWWLLDAMRGMGPNHFNWLYANTADYEEAKTYEGIYPTPTGFNHEPANNGQWSDGDYIYIAIRRPDGYVGKPPELGTGVFAMAYGNSAGTNPSYVSNFPVDFALLRQPATSEGWYTSGRLIQNKYLFTNTTNAETSVNNFVFDHNNGWRDGSAATNYLSWMWKRHAGFDVVAYKGNSTAGHAIPHSLNKIPEMFWIKQRDGSADYAWRVFHKDLNNGVDAYQWMLEINSSAAENGGNVWFNQMPTSTHFMVKTSPTTNGSNVNYIAMLFASVDGISKVGSYTGDDSDDGSYVINVGFTPRFLIIKRADGSTDWKVFDTTNGFPTSGAANYLELNTTDARYTGSTPQVTQATNGFKLWSPGSPYNANNAKYIYYAHA